MTQKGLSHDIIIKAAAKLVEEKGYDNFSMRELAARLDIKASSLYNYFTGIEEVNTAVGLLAIKKLHHSLSKPIKGKNRNDAIKALAVAYRTFAKNNPELYRAIIKIPLSADDTLVHAVSDCFEPIMNIISLYTQSREKAIHIFRSFRSTLHGFVSLETAGFLQHCEVDTEESYLFMVDSYIRMLMTLEDE